LLGEFGPPKQKFNPGLNFWKNMEIGGFQIFGGKIKMAKGGVFPKAPGFKGKSLKNFQPNSFNPSPKPWKKEMPFPLP